MTAPEPRAELVEAVARPWQADDFPGHDADYRAQAVAVLAAVLPLLTLDDVPHLEAAVRAEVAREIEAVAFVNWSGAFRNGMYRAVDIARDGGR